LPTVASWNVNSLRVRLEQLSVWADVVRPDVIGLQEIKLTDDAFPGVEIAALGYQYAVSGQKTYNGVALLSREPLTDVVTDFTDFDDPQRRLLAATTGGVRVVNVYVPNGQAVGSDKYHYKLRWLRSLRSFLEKELATHGQLLLMGDFNIAPEDRDVHDPAAWKEQILCSTEERAALALLTQLGLADTFRLFDQPAGLYSWWDYRAAGFRRNLGLRIDLVLASPRLAARCEQAWIDLEPRRLERPSDHAPVLARFGAG
jgi:exodeoxyribonuclease-3